MHFEHPTLISPNRAGYRYKNVLFLDWTLFSNTMHFLKHRSATKCIFSPQRVIWVWCGAAGPRERTSENSTQKHFKTLFYWEGVFFSVSVCVSVCLCVRTLFKQPGDPYFLLSQSIEGPILRSLTEGNFEIRS